MYTGAVTYSDNFYRAFKPQYASYANDQAS